MEQSNISQGLKVLVVDDSLLIHKIIKKMIEPEGYEVCATAINGKQALEMFEQFKPDIIIMDINMPIMNGLEAAKGIKELDSDAKIVILGSAIDKNVVEQAEQLGVKYFVNKPVEKEKLMEALLASNEGKILETLPRDEKKAEINNIIFPFFRAAEEVFDCMLDINKKIEILGSEEQIPDVGGYTAVVGFTGKINGWFVLNMSNEVGWKVAERVNRERYENKDDPFIGYSVQELANIICGNGVTRVNNTERNLKMRITPPGLFRGAATSMLVYNQDVYQGIMKTELGDVFISVIFEY